MPPLCSEVATLGLLSLNSLEEGLKVASTEALMVPALDDFEEKSGAIFQRLGKDLQKIPLVIVVDEDLLTLDRVDVLLHLEAGISQAAP